MNLLEKAQGCFVGLAVGDALGRPTEGKSPDYIRKNWGKVTDFLGEPGGSDDTEYALFSARLLLQHGQNITAHHIADAWCEHIASQAGGFKGAGFSEMAAIENLRKGILPPKSGEHIHSWSDGLAMRVAPFGIAAAGNPELAADLAYRDGIVSHSGEGIYSGQLVAAAVSTAMVGDSLDKIFESALSVIPDDCWTARAVREGVKIGSSCQDIWEAVEPLYQSIACTYYHWTDLGPEAVGLAFGMIAAARGDFRESVIGGVNVGRDTDTIAAIAGAITGAFHGISGIPHNWAQSIQQVSGTCIHTVAGMHVWDTARQLAELAREWGKST